MSTVLGFSFPNPIDWVIDKVGGFVSGVATAGFEVLIGGMVAWVIDAVVWVVGGVFNFFLDATDPNVQADWFITGTGPYATTVVIGATLLVGFVLAGITQGVMSGDVGGMLRRIALDLPLSVLGMVGLVTVVQALIRLTDALSGAVLGHFQNDISDFTTVVVSLSVLGGPPATALVIFLLGLVTVMAGIILVAELSIRAALIYIVVALAPLVFAVQLWPAMRGMARKLLELLVALILSKLVIAIALSVAAAAAVGTGSGGEVTSLPEPEIAAEDPGGSVTQAVGILLAAMAAFGVSAFSPLLIAKLLPLTEAALIAQGVRSGPMRSAQQGMSVAHSARALGGYRSRQIANGRVPNASASRGATAAGGAGAASAAGGGAAGGAGGGAAAGGAAAGAGVAVAAKAAGVATGVVRTGTNAMTGATDTPTRSATSTPTSTSRPGQGRDRRPPGTSPPPSRPPTDSNGDGADESDGVSRGR